MSPIDSLREHVLFDHVHAVVGEYLGRAGSPLELPPPSDREEYAIDVFRSASSVVECMEQLEFSIHLLGGYRRGTAPPGMNRHDHIVFGLENFYLRSTSVFDRCLRLTNTVFELGLPERQCSVSTVTNNEHVKRTEVRESLSSLRKVTQNVQAPRNAIAHARTYTDHELSKLAGYLHVIEGLADGDPLLLYVNHVKVELDAFVVTKKKELRTIAADLGGPTSGLFGSLTQEYDKRLLTRRG